MRDDKNLVQAMNDASIRTIKCSIQIIFLFWCLYFLSRWEIDFPAYIMKFISKLKCSSNLWNKFSLYLKSAIQNRGHSIYLCLSKGKLFPVKMVLCATFSLGLSFDMRAFSMLNKLSVNGWRLFILCLYILSKHMTYFFHVEFIY